MPLTGLPITDPALAQRQALVVKIDNHPDARPQSGLNAADLVYEENVEQLTRFAAVFQTNYAGPVGPIRSGRTQDVMLLGSLNKPMFAWSGGNAGVTQAIDGSDFFVVRVDANEFASQAGTYRANDREAPHNLSQRRRPVLVLARGRRAAAAAVPVPRRRSAAAGDDSPGVQLAMDGVKVGWKYDAGEQRVRPVAGRQAARGPRGRPDRGVERGRADRRLPAVRRPTRTARRPRPSAPAT